MLKINPIGSNMTEVITDNETILFSYKTPVAYLKTQNGWKGYFKTNKKWSSTTTKHINKWIQGNTAELVN